jgi:U3 small nucleolar RNA-associated protein 10
LHPTSPLYLPLLHTLTSTLTHDESSFYSSPHHFNLLSTPLLSQLTVSTASTLPLLTNHLIPCIIALASATDSPDHHKTINTSLIKHMRDDNKNVRLVAVKTEVALTQKLGEEWLALLPEMLPGIAEGLEDDEEVVEREVRRWVATIEEALGESLEGMLQ